MLKFQTSKAERPEWAVVEDQVFASMETGNFAAARCIYAEYAEKYPERADTLRRSVQQEYGTSLV